VILKAILELVLVVSLPFMVVDAVKLVAKLVAKLESVKQANVKQASVEKVHERGDRFRM
jgi:hypothetical protein